MIIKVQCPCGSRFEFEVEPVGGRMPMAIACPTCGADATELANAVIQQKIGSPPVPVPVPVPAPASGLRIARSHVPAPVAVPVAQAAPASSESAPESAAQLCPKHKTETAVETCCVCGKAICLKCMEQFGYVCSVYCRQQATAKRIYVPVYAQQKSVIAGRTSVMGKRIAIAVSMLVVVVLGVWFWYAWFARNPKIVYSLPIPKPDPTSVKANFSRPEEYYQLIGPGQLLAVKNKQLSLFDVVEGRQIWAAPLRSEAEQTASKAARGTDAADDVYFEMPRIVVTTNDVWAAFSDQLARFDRQTGSRKEAAIKDKILHLSINADSILVVAGTRGVHETLSKIRLPVGDVQTEDLVTAPPPKTPVVSSGKPADKAVATKAKPDKSNLMVSKVPVGQLKTLATQASAPDAPETDAGFADYSDYGPPPYIVAGPNVVEFKTKVLEHKTVSHEAMKPKGKSVLDNANLTASQGLDVAQEMMNDSRREMTGGVEVEDVSRYEVTIHRRLEKDIPDWTGEVTGVPQFFPLKTVDVVTAGQAVYVFDKRNKKLWDGKLTFSVARRSAEDHPPCLETKDALYFADLGILTRYDLATGNVRWRYNSVGISHIESDEHGGIYLVTTTAGPEQIKYSQQVNIHDKIHSLILKLDADTSKVLWREESIGDDVVLSGGFVYSTKMSSAYAVLDLEQGAIAHYNLNLLDPSNGRVIWNIHRANRQVMRTDLQKNWIMVHFDDEVLVWKFFSL
ncbi:MAG: Pyrrolo-quinoline quinone [Pedosphaera sp.]|nr:Pyrrolo-quinoline quinone [Pedosphaera sp.]